MRSLSSGLRTRGKIENLSLSGCRMHMSDLHWFRRGDSVELTFNVRQLPLRVQASIRQLDPRTSVGVEFTLITDRGRRLLTELIHELDETQRDRLLQNQAQEGEPTDPASAARMPEER